MPEEGESTDFYTSDYERHLQWLYSQPCVNDITDRVRDDADVARDELYS